jgi:N-carbamoyl-L-amino-acid hydrolase
MEALGLDVQIDTAGNLLGKWSAGKGKPLVIGSHLDTVRRGGAFDGALGVLSGLYAIAHLRLADFEPGRPIWLAVWMDEEGTRFGTPLFGSRAFAGEDVRAEAARPDAAGTTLVEAMAARGRTPDRLGEACRVQEISSYLELHIEQGPVLDNSKLDLGVVTSIVGWLGYRVALRGEANHAGTTPPDARRDALAGAARVVLALRNAMRQRPNMRANVGEIRVEPGVFNVVPGLADFSIDVRSVDSAAFEASAAYTSQVVRQVAREEKLGLDFTETHRIAPTPLDERLQAVLHAAALEKGATVMRLPSGAAHDAQVIAPHVPTAMLFVPSTRGISHAPEERTESRRQELGAQVLIRAIEELAR